MSRGHSQDLAARTDQVALKPYDRASSVTRPADLGSTYAEHEYDALAREQQQLWPADGTREAREDAARTAWHQHSADAAKAGLAHGEQLLSSTAEAYGQALRVLGPWTHRSPTDHWRYTAAMVLLGMGDTAGIWATAVWEGEIPLIALGQAMATGCAAVTAGLAGGELRNNASARERARDPEQLSTEERAFRSVFSRPGVQRSASRIIGCLTVAVVLLIAAGVFALRTGVEGLLAGLTFGGLAAATALASFISCYVHADEVADLIASYATRYRQAEKHLLRLAHNKSLATATASTARTTSLTAEYQSRGDAAGQQVQALKHRMLRQNPQVVGHGFATTAADPLGRRVREHGDEL